GSGPADVRELSLTLAEHMLRLSSADGMSASEQEAGTARLATLLDSGPALQKFRDLIAAQGGDVSVVDCPQKLPQAAYRIIVTADTSGFVTAIDTLALGKLAGRLGAGRMSQDAVVDPAVGFVLHRKIGDAIQSGEALLTVHANQTPSDDFLKEVQQTFIIGNQPTTPPPLIHAVRGI
ncbi:MAG: hypothetical protein NZT92_22905, partial [Abditibacteriales bacterium]|nr:hypothetical protein [Abditibacteriales bacterium]MDW8366921.1 hypothetical protein [Abditibacteriales bacterium]